MADSFIGYNQGTAPNTKLATELRAVGADSVHFQRITNWNPGAWGYVAGVAGDAVLPGGARLLSLAAVPDSGGGMVSINGGDDIVIPSGFPFSMNVEADVLDPAITFTSTLAYVVQFVV